MQRHSAAWLGWRSRFWIVADEQSEGRGRSGRRWLSPKGNVYASLALRLAVRPAVAAAAFLCHRARRIRCHRQPILPRTSGALALNGPTMFMLSGAKIAGILIESFASAKGTGLTITVGIGINVSARARRYRPAVDNAGLDPDACAPVFDKLARAFETWLARWDQGRGFAAHPASLAWPRTLTGGSHNVSLNGSAIQGKFRGVDRGGGLLLETRPGVVITVNAGDIYPSAQN